MPLTWGLYYFGVSKAARHVSNAIASAALGCAIYLVFKEKEFLAAPFILVTGLFWLSAGLLTQADTVVRRSIDK